MEKELCNDDIIDSLIYKCTHSKRGVVIQLLKDVSIEDLEEMQYRLYKEYDDLKKSLEAEGIPDNPRATFFDVNREISKRMSPIYHIHPDFSLDYDQYRQQLDRLSFEPLIDKLKRMSKNLDKLTNRWEKDHLGLEPRLQILCIREYISKKLNLSYLYDVDDE